MKRIMMIAFSALLLTIAAQGSDENSVDGDSHEKLGYAIGHQVGRDFRRSGVPLDLDAVANGVRDALEGTAPRWTAAEMRDALRRLEANRGPGSTDSR